MKSSDRSHYPGLTVYSRNDCHLCEQMIAALNRLATQWLPVDSNAAPLGIVRVVNVDSDPQLAARFGARVPLLMAGDEELCYFRLDVAKLTGWLARRSPGHGAQRE